jgi:isocitrate dehydrogenase kinase/phosphatase
MVKQFFVQLDAGAAQFAIFIDIGAQKNGKSLSAKAFINVIHQFNGRAFHPAGVFDHLVQHINGDNYLVGTFIFAANSLLRSGKKWVG